MVECECGLAGDLDPYGIGFNRYMVECEWSNSIHVDTAFAVLIDTWWNVNELYISAVFERIGFNRYMVECE